MPKGVEHPWPGTVMQGMTVVQRPLMSKGVEHASSG